MVTHKLSGQGWGARAQEAVLNSNSAGAALLQRACRVEWPLLGHIVLVCLHINIRKGEEQGGGGARL